MIARADNPNLEILETAVQALGDLAIRSGLPKT